MLMPLSRSMHHKAVAHHGTYGNSFALSGCGWLMPFYVGVIKAMKDRGVMNESSFYAGTSSGSLGSLLACCDIPCEDAMGLMIELSRSKVFMGDMDKGLRTALKPLITPEALDRCQGRLHVTLTRVWPNPESSATIISHYDSAEHLLDVVAASCFIPLYSAPKLAVNVGAQTGFYVDGGVLAFMPPIGDITISPFSQRFIYEILPLKPKTFRPTCIYLNRTEYPVAKLLSWVLLPPPEKSIWELYHKGSEAANRWLDLHQQNIEH